MSNNYPSAFYHAHLELVVLNAFSAASVFIMVCLIVDRYIFVFFPARIRTGSARKNIGSSILSSFIAGFMVKYSIILFLYVFYMHFICIFFLIFIKQILNINILSYINKLQNEKHLHCR